MSVLLYLACVLPNKGGDRVKHVSGSFLIEGKGCEGIVQSLIC